MPNKNLSLSLTKKGKEKIANLLADGQKASVKIALGDNYKEFNEIDTTLSNERTRVDANIIDTNSGGKLHIQAYLREDNAAFDIHEVGLLLINSSKGNESDTLLGVYRTEDSLATKNAYVDLFLDITLQLQGYDDLSKIVITLPDYQPVFELSPATPEKLGAVLLATEESIQDETKGNLVLSTANLATEKIIKNNTKGYILTTNHLADLLPTNDSKDEWSCIMEDEKLYSSNASMEMEFAGLLYDPYQKFIYIIYGLHNATEEKSELSYSIYEINQKQLKPNKFSGKQAISTSSFANVAPCCELDGKESINFYFLTAENETNKNKLYRGSFKKSNNELTLFSSATVDSGNLFLYDKKIGVITDNKMSLLNSSDFQAKKEINLLYKRKNPLIQIIQDKIYCIGGGINPINMYTLNSSSDLLGAFCPTLTSNINFNDTESLISTALKNYIYSFKPENYFKQSKQSTDFYRYNVLDNQWQTLAFPKDKLLSVAPTLGSAITVGNDIYLICFNNESNKPIKASILKYTPL